MKKFLAQVGHAELLGRSNGELYHIASVDTLTESTLGFSSSMEEIRAGEGAKLYGRFSHTTSMTVSMTDAMFDLNYIALQIGSEIEGNGAAFYNQSKHLAANGTNFELTKMPAKMGEAQGLDKQVVWVRKASEAGNYIAVTQIKTATVTPADTSKGYIDLTGAAPKLYLPASLVSAEAQDLCARYFIDKPEARKIAVRANFIPAEMVMLLTTKLYAGDANAPETGKAVGQITVKIPRFQLDASFDLSMAMSSAATINLSGSALAVADTGSCDDVGVYAEIVEVTTDSNVLSDLQDLVNDPETNEFVAGGALNSLKTFIGSYAYENGKDYNASIKADTITVSIGATVPSAANAYADYDGILYGTYTGDAGSAVTTVAASTSMVANNKYAVKLYLKGSNGTLTDSDVKSSAWFYLGTPAAQA